MSTSRRRFLKTGAALAAVTPTAKVLGANERVNIGLIGTGGRCRHLMQALAKVTNARMAVLCDVYEPNLDEARKLAGAPQAVARDYRAVLGNRDIDAVLIATPDHWHAPMTIDALAAGKHVYVEKPVTHKLAEGQQLLDAIAKHPRVVQVGTQQRSMPHIEKARQLVKEGRIGRVLKVHMSWNRNSDRIRRGPQNVDVKKLDWQGFLGNAPKQEFDEYRFKNWRWFWDFGNGILTDLMVHWLDVAHWILDVERPERAVTVGNHFVAQDVWQTPDTIQTLLQYPNNLQMHFEGTFSNAHQGAMIKLMGTDGTMYIDRGRFELTPEPRNTAKPEEMILGDGPRGRDFYAQPYGEFLHLENWIDAIRNDRQPSSPLAGGVHSAAAAHLANKAYRDGTGVAAWGK